MHYVYTVINVLGLLLFMQSGAEDKVKFTLWSGNCYAFPVKISSFLQGTTKFFGHEINLVSGIKKTIEQRITETARLVLQKNPDVVVFQELWKNSNKTLMAKLLKPTYPYTYWIAMSLREELQVGKSIVKFFETLFTAPQKLTKAEGYTELNPLKMDSGLFIASKFPLIKTAYITYKNRGGDEVNAHKGALIVLFKDRRGHPVLCAVTHLQSWRDREYVEIRHKQIRQLGEFLSGKEVQNKWALEVASVQTIQVQLLGGTPTQNIAIGKEFFKLWHVKNLTTIIVGDFNDPITFQKDSLRLIDRLACFTDTLYKTGVRVSIANLRAILEKNLNIREYVLVNELADNATITANIHTDKQYTYTINGVSKMSKRWGTQNALYNALGRFYEVKGGKPIYSYFSYATDGKGIQLLDPIFLDDGSIISKYEVLRKEILGDQGPDKSYNPDIALSDHAHIMVEIQEKG